MQLSPWLGLGVKVTVPANPFVGAIAIVVGQSIPTRQETVVGAAEMSKSGAGTVTVIVTLWLKAPLAPVTFTR